LDFLVGREGERESFSLAERVIGEKVVRAVFKGLRAVFKG
jgi:hypothetical protein